MWRKEVNVNATTASDSLCEITRGKTNVSAGISSSMQDVCRGLLILWINLWSGWVSAVSTLWWLRDFAQFEHEREESCQVALIKCQLMWQVQRDGIKMKVCCHMRQYKMTTHRQSDTHVQRPQNKINRKYIAMSLKPPHRDGPSLRCFQLLFLISWLCACIQNMINWHLSHFPWSFFSMSGWDTFVIFISPCMVTSSISLYSGQYNLAQSTAAQILNQNQWKLLCRCEGPWTTLTHGVTWNKAQSISSNWTGACSSSWTCTMWRSTYFCQVFIHSKWHPHRRWLNPLYFTSTAQPTGIMETVHLCGKVGPSVSPGLPLA